MPKKAKSIVLDTWAVVAYFEDETAGEKVADIIADAHEQQIPLLMTTVNAGEAWYIVARQSSATDADVSIQQLRGLGIEFVDADWNLALGAAHFKSRNRMSFADAFAAALAKQREANLVTGDPEFRQIEREVAIHWLH
jgi:predicted nucleic acid-binding protein